MGELPDSLRIQTLRPVVSIIGSTHLHESIIGSISSYSQEEKLDFESLEFSHEFEVRREARVERQSSEGFLKLGWTTKRKKFIPAVALLVFDWSGARFDSPPVSSPDWKSKERTIFSYVRKFREEFRNRFVKIAVLVYISHNEEATVEERTNSVKKATDLESKAIFVVKSRIDDSPQSLPKLKKYLWDSALAHYRDEIERIKKLKSKVQKELMGNTKTIEVRLDFKQGYLNELRQEKDSALNCYKKAYSALVKTSPVNLAHYEEIRTVADWTIYRIWCIHLSAPYLVTKLKEAVTLFKSHIAKYRNLKHKDVLLFERWKWLTDQFVRFGRLLENVPRNAYEVNNLWSHPGFYYMTASNFVYRRMEITTHDKDFIKSVSNWQEFIKNAGFRVKDPDYVGKSKTLVSHPLQSEMIEGISTNDQAKIIKTIEEADFQHLQVSVDLALSAARFYQLTMPMPRVVDQLNYFLVGLYSKKGETQMSFSLEEELIQRMRSWKGISANILDRMIQDSSILGNTSKNLESKVQMAALNQEKRKELLENTFQTLNEEFLQVQVECPRELLTPHISYSPQKIHKYEQSTLEVKIQSFIPVLMENVRIALMFSDNSFNLEHHELITLNSEHPAVIHQELLVKHEISELELKQIILNYEVGASCLTLEINTSAKLKVLPPLPKLNLSFSQKPPVFFAENYPITVELSPSAEILEGKLFIYREEAQETGNVKRASIDRATLNQYVIYHLDPQPVEYTESGITIPHTDSEVSIPLQFYFFEEGLYTLKVKLKYTVKESKDITYESEQDHDLELEVKPPFQSHIKCPKPLHTNSPGLLKVSVWTLRSQQIVIHAIELSSKEDWESSGEACYSSQTLSEGDILSEVFQIWVRQAKDQLSGDLVVKWSRKEGEVSVCRLPLPYIPVKSSPIDLEVVAPSQVHHKSLFSVFLYIKNNTEEKQELTIKLSNSNGFLLGGLENLRLEVSEEVQEQVEYRLIGIEAGIQQLPDISVQSGEFQKTWKGRVLVLP